jgi:hypothetical protein
MHKLIRDYNIQRVDKIMEIQKLSNLFDSERGQIVDARLAGASMTNIVPLLGVSSTESDSF